MHIHTHCSTDKWFVAGTLPHTWGGKAAFQGLETLFLRHSGSITGTLPETWADPGAFPNLLALGLEGTDLSGAVPASWTMQGAFPQLQVLDLSSTRLHGPVPSFHNKALSAVLLDACNFNSTLDAVWDSSSPLQIVSVTNNSLSGSLPESYASNALSQLTYLDVSENRLQGTVPLSWLQPGHLLSHMSIMNLGSVWDKSQAQTAWRQQLCLQRSYYDTDITGQRAALVPALEQHLQNFQGTFLATDTYNTDYSSWLHSGSALTLQSLNDYAQNTINQLASVKDICANRSSERVLLTAWLTLAACMVVILAVYVIAHWTRQNSVSSGFAIWPWGTLTSSWGLLSAIYESFYGLIGLTLYYYDLVTSIIVLTQVWGTWPGGVLAAIFFFHFAATGVVVAFRLISVRVHAKPGMSEVAYGIHIIMFACSIIGGPFMIPIVLVLDTCAFVRQVLVCCERLAKLLGLHWVRPGFIVAFSIHRWLRKFHYLGFDWVNLEKYEGMHNLVAAVLQSLPTVILNSVIFSLGNKPSHGIYFSTGLFLAAIVASCLAMLKCLIVILWQAYQNKVSPSKHAANIAMGSAMTNTISAGNMNATDQVIKDSTPVNNLIQQYHVSGSAPLGGCGGADAAN